MSQPTVYIAYREEYASRIAQRLLYELHTRGYPVIMREKPRPDIPPESYVARAISSCSYFILLLTKGTAFNAPEDDSLREEVEIALEQRRIIIPIALWGFRASDYPEFFSGYMAAIAGQKKLRLDEPDILALMTTLERHFLKGTFFGRLHTVPDAISERFTDFREEVLASPPPDEIDLLNEINFEMASLDYKNGHHEAALARLDALLEADPGYLTALRTRGVVHHLMGNLDAAIVDYSRVLEAEPYNALFYNNRGLLYARRMQFEKSLQDFDQALLMAPKHPSYLNNRAFVRYQTGDLEGAMDDVTKSLKYKSNMPAALDTRAQLYFLDEQYGLALVDFRRAYGLNPNNVGYLAGVAICQSVLHKHEEAHRLWRQALEREPRIQNDDYLLREFRWQLRLIEEARRLNAYYLERQA